MSGEPCFEVSFRLHRRNAYGIERLEDIGRHTACAAVPERFDCPKERDRARQALNASAPDNVFYAPRDYFFVGDS